MSAFETRPLNPEFGVEVTGINLADATKDRLFGQVRALFEEHSALLFRGQDISDDQHKQLAELFGPIEDRKADERKNGEKFEVPTVSNVRDDGSITEEMDLHTLNLKSNFLWHSDSTFLPTPALTNILIGRVVTTEGGATELASTRAAWANMPDSLKAKVQGRGIWHRYSHSRRKISPELAELPMFNKWPDQHWNALWRNPVNGREALYIASHAFKLDGYDEADSQAIIEELIDFCTQPQFVYSHNWQVGDVLIWDQRAVLHRGTPWPYEQPRVLSSICSTVTEADAIETMRISQ
ncbi:TauD/TfdA dioxygenase family protein [Ruegeria arenilitoris]|uniref:TauD/TfdA dioxygenase family protein n=1 Tax=Ruegeria arenilitoris TaxID=1173585 RepID=UPI00147A9AF1|nr:TauD/TfdA family dioxygenase [Ruegeria arenilitoris]